MPRPAIARHEEGTYRPYSTNEERCQTGWIGGQQCEVILDRALRGSDVYEGDGLIMSTIQDQGAGGARGGRRRRSQRRVATSLSEINVVPMVDVMLVLLVIFMVAAPMMQRGLDVSLPVARRADQIAAERLFVTIPLSFRADRIVQVDNDPVRVEILDERMRQELLERTEQDVFLRGDGEITLQELMSVMDKLKEGGVTNVGLVTDFLVER